MRALVTGGGGFIGRALARALRDGGAQVRTFARGPYPGLVSEGFEHVQGDVARREDVERAVEGQDVVFHVAAKVGIAGTRSEFEAVNVQGTDHVIEACRKAGASRLVFTSTPSVVIGSEDIEGADESLPYPAEYQALYPETKAEAERRVLAAHGAELRTVSLRPHIVWGPEDTSLLPRILERAHRLRRIGPDGKKTDVSYIDDVVDAHLLAAEALRERPEVAGGRAYFISSGEPVEIWDFVDLLLDAAGRPPLKGRLPVGVALAAAGVVETAHRWMGATGEPMLSRWVVHELTHSHWFDISAARRDLGFEPKVNLQDGKRRLEAWLKTRSS
ncbi:MAG: NAD-dependent epimerase/dehydratase family protein [Myxococcota bacterium]